jgi:2-polyprenyl-3-methyl-5-hydroxy-6-metoxy-1,4-benzoquinol methylase
MKTEKAQELLELVRNNYQDIAGDFDATRKKEIWPEIRKFAEKVKSGDSVLDLGCGNGRLLEALKGKEIKYLGVDNSSKLISLARENYPLQKFIVGDLLALDDINEITDGTYDFIFCLAALQHIPSQELKIKALKDIAAKLKIGGEIIISNWNLWANKKYRSQLIKNYFLRIVSRNEFDFNDLVFPWKNSRGEKKSNRYYHAFTKKELRKLTHLAGLEVLVLKKDKYNLWLTLKK